MNRKVVLEAVKHEPPSQAQKRDDGFHDLAFNLKKVFHMGYLEVHGRTPRRGTNPYFDAYTHLLADDTDELKWASPGIGRGDHKTSVSQQLGRIFARAYLSLHGYSWFPDIKDLLGRPENGWSVERPAPGDMPDWLVGGGGKYAVAEARGTHSAIHAKSSILDAKWRPQVANVGVRRKGKNVGLKSWLVATRWVSEDQTMTAPKQYVEDPDPPEGRPLERDDEPSLLTWMARVHTLKNLARLEQHRVAARVMAFGQARESVPPANPITWTCSVPGLEKLRFVGRALASWPMANEFTAPFEWLVGLVPPESQATWHRWRQLWEASFDDFLESNWFDGLAVPVLSSLVQDAPPPSYDQLGLDDGPLFGGAAGVSLLSDGSLLAPLSLMQPGPRLAL